MTLITRIITHDYIYFAADRQVNDKLHYPKKDSKGRVVETTKLLHLSKFNTCLGIAGFLFDNKSDFSVFGFLNDIYEKYHPQNVEVYLDQINGHLSTYCPKEFRREMSVVLISGINKHGRMEHYTWVKKYGYTSFQPSDIKIGQRQHVFRTQKILEELGYSRHGEESHIYFDNVDFNFNYNTLLSYKENQSFYEILKTLLNHEFPGKKIAELSTKETNFLINSLYTSITNIWSSNSQYLDHQSLVEYRTVGSKCDIKILDN